jgi:O-antigen/teichoic acid export membrane protein
MTKIKRERSEVANGRRVTNPLQTQLPLSSAISHRRHRQRRMNLAWSTSLLSKIVTIGVQILALPLVYRALGEGGYAAYAAVTASASMLSVFNLGIGGSLVTPLTDAIARQDKREQAVLVQAGLGPLIIACVVGAVIAIPTVALLPLSTLFGRVGATGSWDLRVAAVIAVSMTLAGIPLNAVGYLRQAYQEMHLSNLIGTGFNTLLLIALLIAARRTTALPAFVAIVLFIPLCYSAVNFVLLMVQRPFLLRRQKRIGWEEKRRLLADGIRFLSAAFAPAFFFQWPVYWIARTQAVSISALFAICIQATVLPLGFVYGFMQPLWSSTADALAKADHHWIDVQIRKGRALIVSVGGCAFIMYLFFGERVLHLWLRKPVALDWPVRGLMGAYVLLAIWEQYHFYIALGFGRLREATVAQFQRAVVFGLAVPLLTVVGGVKALWVGMCCSILFWTAWRLPGLLQKDPDAV